MNHLVQTTYNDVQVSDIDHSALFALGAFIRHESETQVTVCCTSDAEEGVRNIILAAKPVEE